MIRKHEIYIMKIYRGESTPKKDYNFTAVFLPGCTTQTNKSKAWARKLCKFAMLVSISK
jgi:hypothetical protein